MFFQKPHAVAFVNHRTGAVDVTEKDAKWAYGLGFGRGSADRGARRPYNPEAAVTSITVYNWNIESFSPIQQAQLKAKMIDGYKAGYPSPPIVPVRRKLGGV